MKAEVPDTIPMCVECGAWIEPWGAYHDARDALICDGCYERLQERPGLMTDGQFAELCDRVVYLVVGAAVVLIAVAGVVWVWRLVLGV